MGRTRRFRGAGAGRDLLPAGRAPTCRQDDRPPEPDPRRHDQAVDQAQERPAASLPAWDGEADGDLHRLRARSRNPLRRRQAPRVHGLQAPALPAALVREGARSCDSARPAQAEARRRGSRRQSLGADSCGRRARSPSVTATPGGPPVLVLGVRRSGTTLLRVMLDRHSELAVPDESYFVPQLADRHLRHVEPDEFVDDLRRIDTLAEWDVPLDKVRARLDARMPIGAAIATVYAVYAAERGKSRWGDKTPMYMQNLRLLERLFPDALFVHLVRDGRDAALSFLSMPPGLMTETWMQPRSVATFACQWRTEVRAARRLGRRVGDERYLEVRYEDLVGDVEPVLRRISDFARLPYEPEMTDYAGNVDVSTKPHQQSLRQPPTAGLRDWRLQMSPEDVGAFDQVAGDLLDELGYETHERPDAAG
ncbi:MAG: sulfotransferase, partial [Actinobacteria bacterium]